MNITGEKDNISIKLKLIDHEQSHKRKNETGFEIKSELYVETEGSRKEDGAA